MRRLLSAAEEHARPERHPAATEHLTAGLVRFITGAAGLALTPEILDASRRAMLDWIGVAIAGTLEQPALIAATVQRQLGGTPEASLVGLSDRTSTVQAALVNGIAGHALDFDDSNLAASIHGTATVLPAALAVGEARGASTSDIMRAFAVGYEVAAYLGEALDPAHHSASWHGTATLGTVGAAAAAAALMRLDERRVSYALGLAATQASGLRHMFGSMAKPFHAGKAASNGVLSALLAEHGFSAGAEAIHGRYGLLDFLNGHTDEPLANIPPPRAPRRILGNDLKLHACCHLAHASIDAALAARAQPDFSPSAEIQRVDIFCSPVVLPVAANPRPRTGLEGKFSVAYCVLAALLDGQASREQFSDERVNTSPTQQLLGRVVVTPVSELPVTTARVVVHLSTGHAVEAEVRAPRGTSANPPSWGELAAKFHDLVGPVLGSERASQLEEAIRALPGGDTAETLINLMRRDARVETSSHA